jgi:hypothetical protein
MPLVWKTIAERFISAARLWIRMREVLASNLDRDTGYPDWGFRGYPRFLEGYARTRQLGRGDFFSNLFRLIAHLPSDAM